MVEVLELVPVRTFQRPLVRQFNEVNALRAFDLFPRLRQLDQSPGDFPQFTAAGQVHAGKQSTPLNRAGKNASSFRTYVNGFVCDRVQCCRKVDELTL